MTARSASIGAIKAATVLANLGIRSPSHLVVEAIAWRFGLTVYRTPLDGAEGCLVRREAGGAILVAEQQDAGRYRFTVAHELGHFLLHPTIGLQPCVQADFAPWTVSRQTERDADDFAAELLLPRELVATRMHASEPSLTAIEALAQEFLTSLTATAIRYVEVSGFPCALVVSSAAGIEWFRVSEDFPGWFQKGQPIHRDSFAYDALRGDVPAGMETVLATAWLTERRWKDVFIKEQTIRLGVYGKALSLIWIPT